MSFKHRENFSTPLKRLGGLSKIWCLFGKSDIPAVTLPTIGIALVLSGKPSVPALLEGILWNQLHLLTFQVKNQGEIDGVEKDRIAKPHRPLLSGLISLKDARILYHRLFVCMWLAAIHSKTFLCTFVYTVAIVIYNEGRLAAIPGLKNIIGAVGLACYSWGTTVIFDHGRELHGSKAIAVLMIFFIFSTTGHARNIRDRSADALMGRRTIPSLLSQPLARWSLAGLMAAWTVGLIALWRPPPVAGLTFSILGLRTLGRYLASYDEKDDYISYVYYGLWLLGSNLLPLFSRIRGNFD